LGKEIPLHNDYWQIGVNSIQSEPKINKPRTTKKSNKTSEEKQQSMAHYGDPDYVYASKSNRFRLKTSKAGMVALKELENKPKEAPKPKEEASKEPPKEAPKPTVIDDFVDYREPYKGPVYCCTVPSGIIYIRRNEEWYTSKNFSANDSDEDGKKRERRIGSKSSTNNIRNVKSLACWQGNSSIAQKGSLGLVMNREDMPYTKSGIVPDIIMNPHAIPSRMTIGHLIEMLMGKICSVVGAEGDATPFNENGHDKVFQMTQILEELGLNKYGYEELYNGLTGEKMPVLIFMGPIYYQRLKHMVSDKIHSRAHGPVTKLTRQPLEGRSKAGGLRFGEMENTCLLAHGVPGILQERIFFSSDFYRIHICDLCGLIVQVDLDSQKYLCKCVEPHNRVKISQVYIPYACKLLFQELMAMAIAPRLLLG
jgi:hypothetical protein